MAWRSFRQVDVFTTTPYRGNPLAVVLDAEGLSDDEMCRFTRWMGLSESAFVLPASRSDADYRVRIFTSAAPTTARRLSAYELPFAGHPTLGACHAWLSGTASSQANEVVQECGSGLVRVRRAEDRLAFAAPPLTRSGPVDATHLEHIASLLGLNRADVVDAQWVDNGPGWVAVLLESADAVLALRPGSVDLDLGVIGPYPPGASAAFEVRAFFPKNGATAEDPVTGSLNAGVAQWLLGTGRASAPYVVRQGTALGREGRVHISVDGDGTVWVGGGTVTCVSGHVEL